MATNWKKNDKVHEVRLKHSQTATDAIKTAAHNSTDPRASGFEDWPIPENDGDTSQNEKWAAQLEGGESLEGINVQMPEAKFTRDRGAHLKARESQNSFGDAKGSAYGRGRADFGRWDQDKGVVDETDEQPRMRGKSRWDANR